MIFIRHLDISHNVSYLPLKILHNLCFSLLLGITAVPREKQCLCKIFFLGGGGGGGGGGLVGGGIRCIMGNVQVTNPIGLANYHFSCSTLFLSREWQGCPINATAAGSGGGERRKGEGRMRCSYFPGYQFRIVISQLQVLQISAV